MQTAAIGYRVADFLKQHPPFNSIEEPDLLSFVSRGRVKFHESDEFLCWQNAAYTPFIFVIQQGPVSLWEDANGKEHLRDVRGPGDIIGIERFLGSGCCCPGASCLRLDLRYQEVVMVRTSSNVKLGSLVGKRSGFLGVGAGGRGGNRDTVGEVVDRSIRGHLVAPP